MTIRHIAITMSVALVAGSILAGCREDEQGRVLMYEPGVYKGQSDQQLGEATADELRRRARMQSGVTEPSGGPSPAGEGNVDGMQLRQRTTNQGGA